ncbi:MAG: EMC3/TMCO1 family protein [Methanomassiliicoccaceae archaeon]|nr:EMC3/TMCO1 family protein [Methanomassiliicoccaceae archaeon]
MPNPGSPQAMQQSRQNMPMPMQKGTMIGMFAVLIIMLVVMSFRDAIGGGLNYVFHVIDFGGQSPVLTLVIAGLIMITVSTVIRSFLTDFVAQARNQKIQSDFNKEMRQAKLENNLYKLKKLQEEQPKMMAKSMETSTQMMKIMPVTMVVIIPIYAWVWYFISNTVPEELLTAFLPWGTVHLNETLWFLPIWIVIYTMISLPIGQLENRAIRYYLLRKRLAELDGIEKRI